MVGWELHQHIVYAAGGRAALEDRAKREGGTVLMLTNQMNGNGS